MNKTQIVGQPLAELRPLKKIYKHIWTTITFTKITNRNEQNTSVGTAVGWITTNEIQIHTDKYLHHTPTQSACDELK